MARYSVLIVLTSGRQVKAVGEGATPKGAVEKVFKERCPEAEPENVVNIMYRLIPGPAPLAVCGGKAFYAEDYLSDVPDNYQTLIGYLAEYFPKLLTNTTPIRAVKNTYALSRGLKLLCEEEGVEMGAVNSPRSVFEEGLPYLRTFPLTQLDTYVRGVLFSEERGVGNRG